MSGPVLTKPGGGAGVDLEAITVDPKPSVDGGQDLGGASYQWAKAYLNDALTYGGSGYALKAASANTGIQMAVATRMNFYANGVERLEIDANINLRGSRHYFYGRINRPSQAKTISSGDVNNINRAVLVIDTESAAASDDLDTISDIAVGDVLTVMAANSARTVVLKHSATITAHGQLFLKSGADRSLNGGPTTGAKFMGVTDGTYNFWLEI